MTDERSDGTPAKERGNRGSGVETPPVSTDRESPVGKPVIRGDPTLTGQRPEEAVEFDPDDPDSLAFAAETVRAFAKSSEGEDRVFILRGAAACGALVRGEGGYTAAAERAGESVSVSFIQKWARVHDLPRSVRRHVATGNIVPSAAKHIARLTGEARLHLAWATLDHDLTVRDIRSVTSDVSDGMDIEDALAERGFTLGEITLELPVLEYCKLRQQASLQGDAPGTLLGRIVADQLLESDDHS